MVVRQHRRARIGDVVSSLAATVVLLGCAGVGQAPGDSPADDRADAGQDGGAGAVHAGDDVAPIGDAGDGVGDCGPVTGLPQSVRPDCPGYCPRAAPAEGASCSQPGARCEYAGVVRCRCDAGGWTCEMPDCLWDAGARAWSGDHCEECPIVDNPRTRVDYGPCSPDALACRVDILNLYVCEAGQYRYHNEAGPP